MRVKIFFLVIVLLIVGCSHPRAKKQKIDPNKPYQTVEFNNFRSSNEDDAKVLQTMGVDYLNDRNLAKAMDCFNNAVRLNPKLYLSWYYLGLLNIGSENSYDYFKKAAEAKPDFPNSYYWMAYGQCRKRDDQKAVQLFKKYIELAKNNPEEAARVRAAEKALEELYSGKDGEILTAIRKQFP